VEQGGEEGPVGWCEPRLVDLALQDGELVAQRKDLNFLSTSFIGRSRTRLSTLVRAR